MWFDLTAANVEEVRDFYAALFGWPMGASTGAQPYHSWIIDGEQPWAGVARAGEATAGRWVPYVVVDDLDHATQRAVQLGATVVKDRTTGPAGTSVTIADPAGALVALFRPSPA
jgi:predicted enzyme related to lactoylglutathione lyase